MQNFKFEKKNREIDWKEIETNLDNLTQDLLDYQAEKHEAETAFLKELSTEDEQ